MNNLFQLGLRVFFFGGVLDEGGFWDSLQDFFLGGVLNEGNLYSTWRSTRQAS